MEPVTPEEVRVLGALVEKQLTTPEYYPLTLNALKAACNQKSKRDPVVSYGDRTVTDAVDGLRAKALAVRVMSDDARVPKYRHDLGPAFSLQAPEVAALAVLMLRGPQTVGEVRGRTERMFAFNNVQEVETVLEGLCKREPAPLVLKLPRQPGTREDRYVHLLCGVPDIESVEPSEIPEATSSKSSGFADEGRIAALEEETASLRHELEDLRRELQEFRSQFE